MKITPKQFDDFEQDFLMKHLKNPDYRYGQAFLSTFDEIYNSIPVAERQRLWMDRDTTMAKRHCLKWVDTNEK
jgi:hypothetical protein